MSRGLQQLEFVHKTYQKWLDQYVRYTGVGDKSIYSEIDGVCNQKSINAYIKTESDLQIKFGGFLELELATSGGKRTFKPDDLTVSSELNIYSNLSRCDLSVCAVHGNRVRKTRADVLNSVLVAIELKTLPWRNPPSLKSAHDDITKLSKLKLYCQKCLIVFDEYDYCDKHSEEVDELVYHAFKEDVHLLLNTGHQLIIT